MEASKSSAGFLLLLGVVIGLVSSSDAYDFYVGGKDGWGLNPSEDYGRWAGRNRFQVNDTLVFKYNKGKDSVLVVKKEDYDSCNLSNPMQRFDDGDTKFKLDRSGPFYFISGTGNLCQKGQKMIIVVLAVRNKPPIQSPPSPAPSSPPTQSPVSPAPSLPPSPTPSPKPPTSSPAPSPSTHVPAPSPSPKPPTSSPGPAPSTHVPSPSPSPEPPTSSPAPAPSTHVPSPSPSPEPPTSSPAPSPSTHVPPPSPSPTSSPSPSGAHTPSSPGSGQGEASAPSPSEKSNTTSSSSSSVMSGLSFGLVALVLGTALIN